PRRAEDRHLRVEQVDPVLVVEERRPRRLRLAEGVRLEQRLAERGETHRCSGDQDSGNAQSLASPPRANCSLREGPQASPHETRRPAPRCLLHPPEHSSAESTEIFNPARPPCSAHRCCGCSLPCSPSIPLRRFLASIAQETGNAPVGRPGLSVATGRESPM